MEDLSSFFNHTQAGFNMWFFGGFMVASEKTSSEVLAQIRGRTSRLKKLDIAALKLNLCEK